MDLPRTLPVPGLEVERELGRGANGVVYLARDVLLGRRVALKVLPNLQAPASEETRDSVLAEARLVAKLSSPHVVTLYRVHADQGAWILEMEYVGGGTLEDRIREKGRLAADDVVRVVSGVARALAAAHAARIVHGDVKPANILFAEDGTPKLADFGIARMTEVSGAVRRTGGKIAGTPFYMAPEVLRWEGSQLASDVWSLGVVAFEALTGHCPFEDESYVEVFRRIREEEPPELPEDTPPRLARLVLECLAKDPAHRPSSAEEVVRQLRGLSASDARFTASVAPSPVRTNLVRPSGSFVGREREVKDVTDLLATPDVRLVTLVGPGGIGKTRLAQEVGIASPPGAFPGGVWFADVSEASDPESVAQLALRALGLREAGAGPSVRRAAEVLQSRERLLLILDNFEQVAEHALETVGAWMRASPATEFLVTSRSVLGLSGERDVELEPLAAPRPEDARATPSSIEELASVRLFVDRAREAKPGFAPDAEVLRCIARICAELEGLPLAIELAASRIRMMSPSQIEANLSRKFQLLATTRKGTAQRQSTLKGAIEWSFGLLSGWERDAFLQASVFVDGFSVEAAEQVINLSRHDDAPFAFDVVQALRDRSLLFARDAGHETRLGMYRAIRDFGASRAREVLSDEDRRALAERHARYFLTFTEAWNTGSGGARSAEALERVGLELGNVQAARRFALESGDAESAARIALTAAEAIAVHRPPQELMELADSTLARMDAGPSKARARLLVHRSCAGERAGDWTRAVRDAATALDVARAVGDEATLGAALLQMGVMSRNLGDMTAALAAWEEAERIATRSGDRYVLAASVGNRGMVHAQQGDPDQAFACYEEAERIARETGDLQTAALHICNRGVVEEGRGNRFGAISCYRDAENLARRVGDRVRIAVTLGNQANVLAQHGDAEGALACYREAEAIAREVGARQRIAQIVGNRGAFHANRGENAEAERCILESESIARELGDRQRVAHALRSRANLLSSRGEHGAAVACLEEARILAAEIGDVSLQAWVLGRLGWLQADIGSLGEARVSIGSALGVLASNGTTDTTLYLKYLAKLADVVGRLGDCAEAARLGAEGVAVARRLGVDEGNSDELLKQAVRTCATLAAGGTPPAA